MFLQHRWRTVRSWVGILFLCVACGKGNSVQADGGDVGGFRMVVIADEAMHKLLREMGVAAEYLSEEQFRESGQVFGAAPTLTVYCFRTNSLCDRSMLRIERMRNSGDTFIATQDISRVPLPSQLDSLLRALMPPLEELDPDAAREIIHRVERFRSRWLRQYERRSLTPSRLRIQEGLS